MSETWTAVGACATALAVLIAAWQMHRNTQQAKTDFEDDLSREYRKLAGEIPVQAHFGSVLSEDEFSKAFAILFRYIDLSNEQVFLRVNGRVSRATWESWRDGIKSNLSKPAFSRAWEEVKIKAKPSFQELRRLETENFNCDPMKWAKPKSRLFERGCRL